MALNAFYKVNITLIPKPEKENTHTHTHTHSPQALVQGWPAHLHHRGQQQFYSEDVQAMLCLYWSLQLRTRAEMFLRNLSLTFSSVPLVICMGRCWGLRPL